MPETGYSVPASEVEITKEWLQTVLASSFTNATFASLESKRIGEHYGFASRIFRYQWQDHGTPRSVVVKLWDTDGDGDTREVLFYQTFREVGARIPRYFYSATDKTTKKAVLVLEDLKDAVQGDVLEPLDLGRARQVARNLAKLHATWLENPKLAELSWISDISTWTSEDDWFHSRRTLFLERFPDHLDGLARLLLDKIELAPGAANKRLKDSPVTLLHGDFHLDNLVFEKRTEPVFLDWSHPVKGAPALNLAQLLFIMTSLENFDLILDHYLDEINKLSKAPLKRTVLEKQLGAALLRLFSISTCGIARWRPVLPRAIKTLERGIEQANKMIAFWHGRDPELFSFIRQ